MLITINNKSSKERIVTCLSDGKVDSYSIEVDEQIEFECFEDLTELECEGTVHFVPTVEDQKIYTLIDDKEIYRSRKQADVLYVLVLVVMCSISILTLYANLLIMGLFLLIQVLIITGIYRILKTEQSGEVVFIER